uniref:Uncharacterized protein n=1 Tax=Physcomitrium patens TaxID=3218 RepID=A0A2K1K765_PHYPA|nr:hypothetical protein PHYPA_011516 [Physcomitrium patens]
MAFHATGKIDFDCFLWLVSEQEQSSFNSFGVSIILISSMMSVMGRCIECAHPFSFLIFGAVPNSRLAVVPIVRIIAVLSECLLVPFSKYCEGVLSLD